jgi:hypothetical protein
MSSRHPSGASLALLTGLFLALAMLVPPGPAAASPGVPPGELPQKVITYEVRTIGTVFARP